MLAENGLIQGYDCHQLGLCSVRKLVIRVIVNRLGSLQVQFD